MDFMSNKLIHHFSMDLGFVNYRTGTFHYKLSFSSSILCLSFFFSSQSQLSLSLGHFWFCPRLTVATWESRRADLRGNQAAAMCWFGSSNILPALLHLPFSCYLCQTSDGPWPATMPEGSLPFSQMGPDDGVRSWCGRIK